MRWFWLYRPQVPTPRAQAIQVVHMAHAMASRGHEVRLCVEPVQATTAREVLAYYGLEPVRGLDLVVLPEGRTVASWVFRARFAEWVLTGSEPTVVIARSKRYAVEAANWLGTRFRLVLESHELDSALAAERGENTGPVEVLEARALNRAIGLVCNAPGTLALWERAHGKRLPKAIALQNGVHPGQVREPTDAGQGAAYAGSALDMKDVVTVATAAGLANTPITMIGARPEERVRLGALSRHKLQFLPPCRPVDVADLLVRYRVLVLPLAPGVFGEHLASPLKLWSYQAVKRPIVGADLPPLHAAAPGAFLPYAPLDARSLADAIDRLHGDASLRAAIVAKGRVRTWAERAEELEAFVATLP